MTTNPKTPPDGPSTGWIPSIVIGAAALLLVQVGAHVVGAWGGLDGTFRGPDSYMRLHRVFACLGGSACEAGTLARSNAPFGEALHWPWLWDWIILAVATPLRLVLDFQTSVLVAAYVLPPVTGIFVIVALTHATRHLGVAGGLPYVGLLVVTQPLLVFLFAYSRPDHHGFQAALFSTALFGVFASLANRRTLWPAIAGTAMGLAIWISTEGLITAIPLLAAVGLPWTLKGSTEEADTNLRLTLWTCATLFLALLVDGPEAGRLSAEFDRASIVHVALFGLIAGFWVLVRLWSTRRAPAPLLRAFATVIGSLIALGIMEGLFPGFHRGPAAEIPEPLWTYWLDYTSEYVPIIQRLTGIDALVSMAPFVVAFPVALWAAFKGDPRLRYHWLVVAGALTWFQGLATFQQVRWSTYAHLLAVLPSAWLLGRLLRRTQAVRSSLMKATFRISLVCLVALGPAIALSGISLMRGRRSYDKAHGCDAREVVSTLTSVRAPSGGPPTVLAPIFWGPEILFRTESSVVATPYHRNVEGIMDSYRIMSSAPEAAREMIVSRGITHIAICTRIAWIPYVETNEEGTFFKDLVAGELPEWLESVPIHENEGGVQVLAVQF